MSRPAFKSSLWPVLLLTFFSACATLRESPVTDGLQSGTASWYGKDFHGRPTASGEIYNMYGMTAAHKTLPLGTALDVTNLDNGRQTKVIVNDRGPFVAGRIIDLSYSAAKELDMVGPGIARVSIKVTGRDGRYVRKPVVDDRGGGGNYVVQLGAFTEVQNAERLKTAIGWKRQGVYMAKAEVSGRTFFRVRIGEFKSKDRAYKLAEALAEEGYHVVVMRD